MFYTDIHSHMLCGVDDGAKDEKTMYEMLDTAYRDGTRTLCLTPHYQPVYYGNNVDSSSGAFEKLTAYAKEHYPDMKLYLANELGYFTDCIPHVAKGSCRLIGGKYLLVDFFQGTPLFTIRYAMEEMLACGYNVILAHVERYGALDGEEDLLEEWERRGARFQVNAGAFAKKGYRKEKRRVKKLMRRALVHVVASDSHDMLLRPPSLRSAEEYIASHYGAEIAKLLLSDFPTRIVKGEEF